MNSIIGQPQTIKKLNKDMIIKIIKAHGPISKPQISKITNLSLPTVNKTVGILLNENTLIISGISKSTGGRRAQLFEFNGDTSFIVALYYYNDTYLGAVSNVIGEIKYRKEFKIRTESFEHVMEDTYKAIDDLIYYCKDKKIKAIGIGVPGVSNNGIISNIPNISSWEGKNIKKTLEQRYNYTICLENDVNLTTIGIYYNKYKNQYKNIILVYIGDGIGSGIIINQELFKGSTNFAGELSYLRNRNYFDINNKKSKYKGDFENDVNMLKQFIKKNSKDRVKLEDALINTLADGLLNIICILNPELIVIQSKELSDEDISKVRQSIIKYIDERNVPKLVKLREEKEESLNGVVSMCISEIISEYSLQNRKGWLR